MFCYYRFSENDSLRANVWMLLSAKCYARSRCFVYSISGWFRGLFKINIINSSSWGSNCSCGTYSEWSSDIFQYQKTEFGRIEQFEILLLNYLIKTSTFEVYICSDGLLA